MYITVENMIKTVGRKQKMFVPTLRGHIWIEGSEGTFLGYGRVALLERIREYGSITEAAKSLGIPYRKAWLLIDSMNQQVPKPYVATSAGGKKGGGTIVTPEGEQAIVLFWEIHEEFQKFIKSQTNGVKSLFKT